MNGAIGRMNTRYSMSNELNDLFTSVFERELIRYPRLNTRYLISKENPFNEYTKEDIELIENTEDEINKIVIELAEHINKNNLPDPNKNELNNLFISVFEKNLKRYPGIYEFHPKKLKFNVGSDFLRDNKDFLR